MRTLSSPDMFGQLPRQLGKAEERAALEELAELRPSMTVDPGSRPRYHQLRDRFAMANVRLLKHIAWRFRDCNVEFDDLVQAGMCGMLTAIDRWESEKAGKVSFAAYAVWWIRKAMQDEVNEVAYPVRLTRSPGAVTYAKEIVRQSLDIPLGPDDQRTLGQLIEAEDDGARRAVEDGLDAETLLGLTEGRGREVLRLYYLDGLMHKEIGARMGFTAQHAGQIVRDSLETIRGACVAS
ncbi:sigma-70 family RNA polymerase sigma factor [Singulisphaera rosea]